MTVWLQRFVRPCADDLSSASYTTYYFIALTLGLVLWLRRAGPTARRFIFTLTVCYYVSYAGYFAIPALGPRFALASQYTVSLDDHARSRRTIDDTINSSSRRSSTSFRPGTR